jgi:DNA primase
MDWHRRVSTVKEVPIADVADALGITVVGRTATCIAQDRHRRGDRHPSMVLLTDVNRFRCYGCDVKGDVIDFVRAVLNLSFLEAVEWLEALPSDPAVRRQNKRVSPLEPPAAATAVYRRLFELCRPVDDDTPGGAYLASRCITVSVAAQHHVVEMLSPAEVWASLQAEFPHDLLRTAGLVSRRGHFLFARHPLLFFHVDGGVPTYVAARCIDGRSDVNELSLAGVRCPAPYLADTLRHPHELVVVCEGRIDPLSAVELGYTAVGVPGVHGFRDEWLPLFGAAKTVGVAFDLDCAGREAGRELRTKFRLNGIPAVEFQPCAGKDLNDCLRFIRKRATA